MTKVLIIQSIFGLFPLKINNDKVEFSYFKWIYSFILHGIISTTYSYVVIFHLLQDGLQTVFRDTRIACVFLQIMNLNLVYEISIVGILMKTRKCAKLFNNLNNMERKVERFRKPADNSEQNIFRVHFIIFVAYFVFYFVLKLNINSAVGLVSSICFAFAIMSVTLISFFIRLIASILNNRMEVIISTLDEMSLNSSNKDVKAISECFLTFGELSHCKELLSKVFGFHLFSFFCFDFIGISIFLYLLSWGVSSQLGSNTLGDLFWPIVLDLLVFIVPYVFKEFLLVHEMDKLGQKVIS